MHRSEIARFLEESAVFLTRPHAAPMYDAGLSNGWNDWITGPAFAHELKTWLGHRVHVAGRTSWVDLNPLDAANKHLAR